MNKPSFAKLGEIVGNVEKEHGLVEPAVNVPAPRAAAATVPKNVQEATVQLGPRVPLSLKKNVDRKLIDHEDLNMQSLVVALLQKWVDGEVEL